jgi:hypothetical protein
MRETIESVGKVDVVQAVAGLVQDAERHGHELQMREQALALCQRQSIQNLILAEGWRL